MSSKRSQAFCGLHQSVGAVREPPHRAALEAPRPPLELLEQLCLLRRSKPHLLNEVRRHLREFRAIGKNDQFARLESILGYLRAVEDLLSAEGVEPGHWRGGLNAELRKALEYAQQEKKHPLIHSDAPRVERGANRSWVEAYASAILEWGLERLEADQTVLAERISDVLTRWVSWMSTKTQWVCSSSGASGAGKVPIEPRTDFNFGLERLRTWGFETTTEALDEFRDLLRNISLNY